MYIFKYSSKVLFELNLNLSYATKIELVLKIQRIHSRTFVSHTEHREVSFSFGVSLMFLYIWIDLRKKFSKVSKFANMRNDKCF